MFQYSFASSRDTNSRYVENSKLVFGWPISEAVFEASHVAANLYEAYEWRSAFLGDRINLIPASISSRVSVPGAPKPADLMAGRH